MKLKKYIRELKRRNVFKSAITYLIAAWLILQVVSTVIPLFDASERNVIKILLIILSVGFPFWIAFSWVYDITSEGILKTEVEDIDQKSQRSVFDNKRFYIVIIASLTITVVLLLFNQFWSKTEVDPNSSQIETSVEEERKSIAVLPFENRSELKQDEFFTNGIHDDLLTQISKIREIKTISRTSVLEYRNTTKNMRVIGEELGVATILEGGVRRAGNQIRINVQLIDVITDANLWAETYTKELTAENVFAIQSEIAHAVAKALKTVLTPQEKIDIEKLPTQNLAALEAWFQAKTRININTSQSNMEAIPYLKKAINLDDGFAMAYAQLGIAYMRQISEIGLPREEQIAKAKTVFEKAIQLDSSSSEVHRMYGQYLWAERDLIAAETAFKKAIELNQNNAIAYAAYGWFYQYEHKNIPLAIEYYYKGIDLDPLDPRLGITLARLLKDTGQFEKAREIAKDILSLKPNYKGAYSILSGVAFHGDFQLAKAIRFSHKKIVLDPSNQFDSYFMGFDYMHTGDIKRAIEWFSYTLELAPKSVNAENIRANIYKLQGEYKKSFDAYIKVPENTTFFPESMYYLMELGIIVNRSEEVIEHFRKIYPGLFQSNVIIDVSNFTSALALGRLLKAKGNDKQANHLLNGSLIIAQQERFEGWVGEYNNWECRVNLALGNNKEALFSYKKLIDIGYHSDMLLTDPIYEPLYEEPVYQQMIKKMKTRLEEERTILREMEANGELAIPTLPNKVSRQ